MTNEEAIHTTFTQPRILLTQILSASARIAGLGESIEIELGQDLTPVLRDELVPAIRKAAPEIGKLAASAAHFLAWLLKNPWEGIPALILAKVTADIAKAAIGKSIESVLLIAMRKSGIGKAMAETGTEAKEAGSGLNVLVAALAAAGAIYTAGNQADKLAKEVHYKGHSWDAMLGFRGGKFSLATLVQDIMDPTGYLERVAKTEGGLALATAKTVLHPDHGAHANTPAEYQHMMAAAKAQQKAANDLSHAASDLRSAANHSRRTDPVVRR